MLDCLPLTDSRQLPPDTPSTARHRALPSAGSHRSACKRARCPQSPAWSSRETRVERPLPSHSSPSSPSLRHRTQETARQANSAHAQSKLFLLKSVKRPPPASLSTWLLGSPFESELAAICSSYILVERENAKSTRSHQRVLVLATGIEKRYGSAVKKSTKSLARQPGGDEFLIDSAAIKSALKSNHYNKRSFSNRQRLGDFFDGRF